MRQAEVARVETELSQRKEYFSDAYLQAISAVAGFTAHKWTQDLDRVDWTIAAPGRRGTVAFPRLDVQLKCTERDEAERAELQLAVDVATYDALRAPNVLVPRILVALVVPHSPSDWLRQTDEQLALRRCAYYASLRGRPDTGNVAAVSVGVPRAQMFTVEALHRLMELCARGDAP